MAVYVEGPNCVGKTTLCEELARILDWPIYYKRSADRGRAGSQTFDLCYPQTHAVRAIVDRWWPSEVIMAAVHQRPLGLTRTEQWVMSLRACRTGGVFILLSAPADLLAERWSQQEEPLESQQDVLAAAVMYAQRHRAWWSMMPSVRIRSEGGVGFGHEDLHKVIGVIKTTVASAEAFPRGKSTGTLERGKVLFVGDRVNPKSHVADHRPFFSRRDDSTCGFLYRIMERAGLKPKDVHLCNAYTKQGEPLLSPEMVALLEPAQVVALGDNAMALLTQWRIPHRHLPHPSWIRRFDRENVDRYGDELAGILGL